MEQTVIHSGKPFAIYAEFAKLNILMKNGLNRRVFNTVEAQYGHDIHLEDDGSVMLHPGSYRISGFSMVTMQATDAPPVPKYNNVYPGYCLLYQAEYETNNPLGHNIGIGSLATSLYSAPSIFDLVFTCDQPTLICAGHQAGDELNNEVFLTINEVQGTESPYHVFARIAIHKL